MTRVEKGNPHTAERRGEAEVWAHSAASDTHTNTHLKSQPNPRTHFIYTHSHALTHKLTRTHTSVQVFVSVDNCVNDDNDKVGTSCLTIQYRDKTSPHTNVEGVLTEKTEASVSDSSLRGTGTDLLFMCLHFPSREPSHTDKQRHLGDL